MSLDSMIVIPWIIWIAAIFHTPVPHEHNVPDKDFPEQWKLVRNAGGVKTFYRWTTSTDGIYCRERKGEMQVNCSLQDAVRLVSDAESTTKWMASIDENYNLTRINQNEWYTYTLFSIPWPFTKRDLVSLNKMVTNANLGNITIAIASKDKFVPLKPGITRLTDYKATWVLTKVGEKITAISFSAISSTSPAFPRAIQDPIIERMFHNNLVRLKDILAPV